MSSEGISSSASSTVNSFIPLRLSSRAIRTRPHLLKRNFSRTKACAEKIQLASELLTFSAMTVVLFTVVQATSSILQGLRKQKIPMYTMIAGVAVKILLNYLLIGTSGIHIHPGPYASIACYLIVMIVNSYYVCKYTDMRFDYLKWVIRPGAAAAAMGFVVWMLQHYLPLNRVTTIAEIVAGILVYGAAAIVLKVLSLNDIKKLIQRKGRKE